MGGLQQSGPPSNTHCTATIRNVTESTIELSQRKSSDRKLNTALLKPINPID